jgi:hypothetical protein
VTLFLHEVHRVRGKVEDDFEAAYRDPGGWMDLLGRGEDARLLTYFHQVHGSGPSYRVVTVTAVADGAAWERLAVRLQSGDLHEWAQRADALRRDVTSRLLTTIPWSPPVDMAAVPAVAAGGDVRLWMEDTMRPHRGGLGRYLEAAAAHYVPLLERPESLLILRAGFVSLTGPGPSVTLLQEARDPARIVQLLASEIPPSMRPPGSWMHDALQYRDQWQSRLLRSSGWSPWP